MMRASASFLAAALLLVAAPLVAQVPNPADTTAAPPDTVTALEAPPPALADTAAVGPDVPVPAPPDTAAVEAPAPADTAAVEAPVPPPPTAGEAVQGSSWDWEFSLSPGTQAVGARGVVHVTEGESDNGFLITVSGLPPVDSLDEEGRDVAEYTVWVVPSKDRVLESTLAGTVAVDSTGSGSHEGRTELDTFGIAVLATPAGTTALGEARVVPVLTGIPVTEAAAPADEAPAAEPAPAEETPAAEPAPEMPAPEMPAPEVPEPPAEQPAPPPPGLR